MTVKLLDYKGYEIFVTEDGKFTTRIEGKGQINDRALSKVKTAIDRADPTVKLMRINKRWNGISTEEIEITSHRMRSVLKEDAYTRYAEVDEAVMGQVRQLAQQEEDEKNAVGAKYNALKQEVIDSIRPLTEERIDELAAEAKARKLAQLRG